MISERDVRLPDDRVVRVHDTGDVRPWLTCGCDSRNGGPAASSAVIA